MTVVVPVARAQAERRTDGDVVDDELGRDHRRERGERQRELFQSLDDVLVRELRRDARRGRRRGLAPQQLGVVHARESLRDLRRRPVGRSRRTIRGRPSARRRPARRASRRRRRADSDDRRPAVRPSAPRSAPTPRPKRWPRRRARDTSARPRRPRAACSSRDRRASSRSSPARAGMRLRAVRRAARDRAPRPAAAPGCAPGSSPAATTSLRGSGRRRSCFDSEHVGDAFELPVDFPGHRVEVVGAEPDRRATSRSTSGAPG